MNANAVIVVGALAVVGFLAYKAIDRATGNVSNGPVGFGPYAYAGGGYPTPTGGANPLSYSVVPTSFTTGMGAPGGNVASTAIGAAVQGLFGLL